MKTIPYRCEVCGNRISLYQEDMDVGLLGKPKIKERSTLDSFVMYCGICKMSRTFVKETPKWLEDHDPNFPPKDKV
ncbi:MAG: hypothetical protein KAW92_11680 [Candidatus Cloacimonetes bacterium]|nr:hypothetical protein [Candidatus Cloacimonadota bacterium]